MIEIRQAVSTDVETIAHSTSRSAMKGLYIERENETARESNKAWVSEKRVMWLSSFCFPQWMKPDRELETSLTQWCHWH